MLIELNVDALVGPTHHFGGLGVGNVASQLHRSQPSRPRAAALEGLQKAELVASFGVPQFVWLPPMRPRLDLLSQLGFSGPIGEQIERAYEVVPQALSAAFSSAFMWAANSATVTPVVDARDAQMHVTPANLISSWHRSSEAFERAEDFRWMFQQFRKCTLHSPLPAIVPLRDEGAANHMRLSGDDGLRGIHIFVHGQEDGVDVTTKFLPRHTRAASEALARQHQLDFEDTFFLHQHPQAISVGVFHNDVIATSHCNLFIHHELAFLDAEGELERLDSRYRQKVGQPLVRRVVSASELPLQDTIESYFFNSQIISPDASVPGQPRRVLICPDQCREVVKAQALVNRLVADPEIPIDEVCYVTLAESMANGGGPACLRLRMQVDADCLNAMPPALRIQPKTTERLRAFIERRYPDRFHLEDVRNPELVESLSNLSAEFRAIVLSNAV